jgi:hypothetical protein
VNQSDYEGLINLQKIQLNPTKSNQIQPNRTILKHFYFMQNQTDSAFLCAFDSSRLCVSSDVNPLAMALPAAESCLK